ncbi:MAG: drug/metabolite transporter (DMT)-like permease [Saprospiraceae bacterium]|jgi:drug/metabolite transporter (DMT)-like permease
MAWGVLLLAILFSALLTIIFKYYQKYEVNTPVAIVFNYVVAGGLAFAFSKHLPSVTKYFEFEWVYASIGLALLFITLFNLLAFTSQKIGITQSNIANKTTFIFPAIMGIWFFHESVNWIKIIGILAAVVAVIITAKEKSEQASKKHSNFLLIITLFLGGGLLDLLLSYAQNELIPSNELSLFSGYSFALAGTLGAIQLIFKLLKKQVVIRKKDIIAGFALGFPNYFSIFLFLKALSYAEMETSVAFTVANMGIIVTATFLSTLLFKEKISKRKLFSIALAITAIILVSFSDKLQ